MKIKNRPAYEVYLAFRVYEYFLAENNLEDDSEKVSVKDVLDFVENQIGEEETMRILDELPY